MNPDVHTSKPRAAHSRPVWQTAASVIIAWLGLYLHNAVEFPQLPPSSPETSVPTLVWLGLFLVWWALPGRGWALRLLFGWGLLSLAGALTTVLPLRILPFRPEQSLRHYAMHLISALTLVPVLLVTGRKSPSPPDGEPRAAA